MKVKQLIRELKKMPQNCEVGVSMHDNAECEVAGWADRVYHFDKHDHEDEDRTADDRYIFDGMPDECVIVWC